MELIHTVFLALGSNLGEREVQINRAVSQLNSENFKVDKISDFFYSAAWGYQSENEFCNLCLKGSTSLDPMDLLDHLKTIENNLGRKYESDLMGYEDRIIDIDIIFFGNLVLNSPDLTIPHPYWNQRNFVYWPLMQLL